MWDNSTITDAGSTLLSRWAGGGTLTITGAAAGTGCVDAVALAKQTALVNRKQSPPIVNYAADADGIQYTLRLTAADEGYIANQIGIFGKLDNGDETLIAIYQDETGIPIPDKNEMADFLYAFYATIQMNNGPIEVVIDPHTSISRADAVDIINSSSLRVDAAQVLTDAQKQQARENMGLAVDSALSSTSANPVQNKVVNEALNGKAPTSHRSTGTTYGAANASYYGHVKLSDSTSSTSGASNGVAATPAAVKAAYDLANGKAPASHSHNASDVSGLSKVATTGSYNDLADTPEIPEGTAVDSALSSTSANPVQNKVVNEALNGKAPKNHAASSTTYGAGSSSNYGHVKLSDSTSSTSGASNGVAATPAAVKAAYDLANGKAPASHNHSASNITSGTLPVARGGTGASTAAGARTNLGIPNPTTSDKGKFLRVNSSGAYVLETVTAAEGVSF